MDWPSETDTLKINLPRDREGYDGFEYGWKALDEAHQMVRGSKLHFIFLGILNNNFTNNDNGAWIPAQLDAPRRKF